MQDHELYRRILGIEAVMSGSRLARNLTLSGPPSSFQFGSYPSSWCDRDLPGL